MEASNTEQVQQDAERNAREQLPAFIAISRVKEISGFSKSTLLRWIAKGKFPAAVIDDGGNVKRWCLRECLEWRAEQFRKRDERERPTA